MSFDFEPQKIKDVILIKPKIINDNRGCFFECYKYSEFKENGIEKIFVQDNYSKSHSKVLRGLHYQKPPYSQAKLIRCVKGSIYDVAVDIRHTSPTFGTYIKAELSEHNQNMLYIPEGFAHGFLVISDEAEIHYKVSKEYNANADSGILWSDKKINIDWGVDFEPILSLKDMNLPLLTDISKEELNIW